MGTPKRERQKANRQQRLEELARQARTQKRKRSGMYVLLIPLAALALYGIVKLVTRSDNSTAAVTSDSVDPFASTTIPSTTIDPNAPTTTLTPLPSTIAGATVTGDTTCPAADGSSPRTISFAKAPPSCIDATKTYTAVVTTNKGAYTIALDASAAPLTVNNFVVLARYHYFDNTICHRAIPAFAVQCGDPTGTGTGGPGYSFADELPAAGSYKVGSIAMANSGPDTDGSQFFIITGASGVALPANYTLFGQVTDGLDTTVKALDALGNPDQAANGVPPLEQIIVQSVTITEA
ncbi:MAG: peptidyl-prolyl cis-trans isomerase [Ilumatobacteraceae bacterium]